jgi:hypothetical protein
MISRRDLEYIENRLSAPAVEALEAYERLAPIDAALSGALMDALQTFTDECRRIRTELSENARRERIGY